MDSFETACALLPLPLRRLAEAVGAYGVEEIRLRTGHRLALVVNGSERDLGGDRLTEHDLMQVLERATGASLHSAAPAMAKGFISFRGLRIGVCGRGVINQGILTGFRDFSSLAIRLPRECRGICSGFIDALTLDGLENTLVISPPGMGKTTLLRELIRVLSERGIRISVLDERNELSASDGGRPCFDLGRCTDVLVDVPKTLGADMLLRGMNPQVIAMDEISGLEDRRIMEQILGCGVTVLASAHGKSRQDMLLRPMYRELFGMGAFKNLLTISREEDKRRYVLERLE